MKIIIVTFYIAQKIAEGYNNLNFRQLRNERTPNSKKHNLFSENGESMKSTDPTSTKYGRGQYSHKLASKWFPQANTYVRTAPLYHRISLQFKIAQRLMLRINIVSSFYVYRYPITKSPFDISTVTLLLISKADLILSRDCQFFIYIG